MASHEHDHDHGEASGTGDHESDEAVGAGTDPEDTPPEPSAPLEPPVADPVDAPLEPPVAEEPLPPDTNGSDGAPAAAGSVIPPDPPETAAVPDTTVSATNGHGDQIPVAEQEGVPGAVADEPVVVESNGHAGPPAENAADTVDAGQRPPGAAGRRAPGGARGPSGRPADQGRPPARGRAGGAGRRPGPPRGRRRTSAPARTRSEPAFAPDGDEPPPPKDTRRGLVILLSCLSVLAVVLTIVAIGLSRSADRKASTSTTTPTPTSTVPALPDAAFTTFRDDETGFSMRYPTTWQRLQVPVAEVRLFVTNGDVFRVQVRVQRTEEATTAENLGNLRAFTDGSVAGDGVQVLSVDPVTVNGLLGYRYLYTFTDSSSGIQGAHLHYFLFQGHKMNSIVFEALPTDEFARAEGVFNQMIQSFRSDPEPASPTTAPPAPGTAPGG